MTPPSVSRRTFLSTTGSLLAAVAAAQPFAAAEPTRSDLELIDTHVHLWNRKALRLPWIPAGSILDRDYSLADYHQAVAGVGRVIPIYMEVAVDPAQQDDELQSVSKLLGERPDQMPAAVLGGQPESPQFPEYLQRLTKNRRIKGIRAPLRGQAENGRYTFDAHFVAGVKSLADSKMSFDINVGPDDLARAADLIAACPGVQFILDHSGNVNLQGDAAAWDRWRRGMESVGRSDRVVCKISGFIATAKDDSPPLEQVARVVDHAYDCFGPDRVMFGGDWPVCTRTISLAKWIDLLRQVVASRAAADQHKLFFANASRFYGVR